MKLASSRLPLALLAFVSLSSGQTVRYDLRSLGLTAEATAVICQNSGPAKPSASDDDYLPPLPPPPPKFSRKNPVSDSSRQPPKFCGGLQHPETLSQASANAEASEGHAAASSGGQGFDNRSYGIAGYVANLRFIPPRGSSAQELNVSVDAFYGLVADMGQVNVLLSTGSGEFPSSASLSQGSRMGALSTGEFHLQRPFKIQLILAAEVTAKGELPFHIFGNAANIALHSIRASLGPQNAHGAPNQRTVSRTPSGATIDLPAGWTYTLSTQNDSPSPVSVTPSVSSGNHQLLNVVYSAPNGYENLDVVNLLINDYLDGRNACYLAYSRPSNALYIVADNGNASQLTGKVMDRTGFVGNSQCSVALVNSSAAGNGNTLTLTLDVSFNAPFGGNRVIYAAARGLDGDNSGWQTMGAYGVLPLPLTFPNPTGIAPSSGASAAQAITFEYKDLTSATNLQTVWGLINNAIDGRGACYFAYFRPGNRLYLYPDNGDGARATSMPLTGTNALGNNQCMISAQGASVQASGNTLKLTLPITFHPGFNGFQGIWLAAQTLNAAQTSPWQALGAWAVPEQ